MSIDPHVVPRLANAGVLRVALNLANPLLVRPDYASGSTPDFGGVAPELAKAIAARLGVEVAFVPFNDVGSLVAAVDDKRWDIAFVGADPARRHSMRFTSAYAEIPVTGLVHSDSPLASVDEIDREGLRILSIAHSAFDLWLQRHIRHARIVQADSASEAAQRFRDESFDVLAGLKQQLLADMNRLPDTRMLMGRFTAIQQSIAIPLHMSDLANSLEHLVVEARESGLIGQLIKRNCAEGLSAADTPRVTEFR